MGNAGETKLLRNEDVNRVELEIPAGHRHIRTTVTLSDGSSLVFQEATIAAIVRGYVSIKTDAKQHRVLLSGRKVEERKAGYAEWQLVEED